MRPIQAFQTNSTRRKSARTDRSKVASKHGKSYSKEENSKLYNIIVSVANEENAGTTALVRSFHIKVSASFIYCENV